MPLSFDSPIALLIAAGLCCAILGVAWLRRLRLGRWAAVAMAAGLLLLIPAAGRMHIHWPVAGETIVMVDLSPSTRSAGYRDRAILQRRIDRLLDGAPYRIVYFAGDIAVVGDRNPLPDLQADRTRFAPPPDANAILLFSDGQFELPAFSPPVFAVVDEGLIDPGDAAIVDLHWQGNVPLAIVRNGGDDRQLTGNGQSITVPPGRHAQSLTAADPPAPLTARLSGGDAWPENDALSIAAPPPVEAERWWISHRPPPSADWKAIGPEQVPASPGDWLGASVVVLDNVAAGDLSLPKQRRLLQYVRDLGGAVVIIGGDRSFAAGNYSGTVFDALSPLISSPPQPTWHWIILTDASGSMAQAADGTTRLQVASAAVTGALRALPASDLVTLGSFSDTVRWWVEATPVADAAHLPLPPPDLQPRGPTNLEAALQQLMAAVDPALPTDILLLTDGQATLDDSDRFIDAMRQRNLRLHLLATGGGEAISTLERIVAATGGQVVREADPRRWVDQATSLAQQAMPDHLMRETLQVSAADRSLSITPGAAQVWNRTWLKDDAVLLATARFEQADVPMIARWQAGSGRVIAAAYELAPRAAEALATSMAAPPRDPRFAVGWVTGATLRVTVDAVEGDRYLNDLDLAMDLAPAETPADTTRITLAQTAPGEYEATHPAPRDTAIATVRHGDRVLERRVIAGRYPAEFDAIGLDRAALNALADRSGGRVIEPDHQQPLDLPARHRSVDVSALLAAAAVLLMGLGLLLWRRR